MWRTKLTAAYELQVPFVSAGMGFVALPELVVAVSEGGGLGLLGVAVEPPETLEERILTVMRQTKRPFGVDLIYENTAMGPSSTEVHIEVCVRHRVPVVVFFWNMPPREWIDRLQAAGTKVWLTVHSASDAHAAAECGIDAVIAQGNEAGGHNKSQAGLMALLPVVRDLLPATPVIAAGGIADGRGVAAAITLGADGVCVGTRLLASAEAYAHQTYKQRVIDAGLDDVTLTHIFGPEWPDQPMRVLRNSAVAQSETSSPTSAATQQIGVSLLNGMQYSMPVHSAVLPTPDTQGDFDQMCLAAGYSAHLTRAIQPAVEIMREMMGQAEIILRNAANHCPDSVEYAGG